jgi:hypothetical protein
LRKIAGWMPENLARLTAWKAFPLGARRSRTMPLASQFPMGNMRRSAAVISGQMPGEVKRGTAKLDHQLGAEI